MTNKDDTHSGPPPGMLIAKIEIGFGGLLFVYATLLPMIGRFVPALEPDTLYGLWPILLMVGGLALIGAGAGIIKKVLESAIANAEHNDGADIDALKITRIYVEKGTVLKRFTARAKGRGNRILKPTCHIFVTVGD